MRRTSSARGIAATEFALWLPILVLLVAGVIDWGAYMNTRAGVTRAVIDGARVGASKFESDTDAAGSISAPAATARATEVLTNLGLPCTTGCVVSAQFCPRDTAGPCDATTSGGVTQNPPVDSLLVSIRYDFVPWFGFAFTPTTVTDSFVMAMESQRAPAP